MTLPHEVARYRVVSHRFLRNPLLPVTCRARMRGFFLRNTVELRMDKPGSGWYHKQGERQKVKDKGGQTIPQGRPAAARVKGCLLGLAAHLAGGLMIFGVFALAAGPFLAATDVPAPADAIVVLAASVGRTRHAVDLFHQGYAPVVVFSDAALVDVGLSCSYGRMSLEAAQELGLPAGVAVIADRAESTYDEAENVRRLVRERGWRSLIVVTDPFHTRRAGRTFRTLMPEVTLYLSAAPTSRYEPGRWWKSENGLIAAFSELIKLGFYWLEYGVVPFGR